MRIVSKKKDYYDGVQGLGQDLDLVYIRDPKEVKVPYWPFTSSPGGYSWSASPIASHQHVVGFCGTLYSVLQMFPPYNYRAGAMSSDKIEYMCHTIADVDAFMTKFLNEKQLEAYHGGKKSRTSSFGWNRFSYERFYENFEKAKDTHKKLFEENRSPIFVSTRMGRDSNGPFTITFNALLRKYDFARVKDPYTAFQDIRMYLSNMAMPERPIPQLSNEDMAHSKGHGDKWSFRRPPTKKKT
jgi:hypothetical protein